MKKTLVLLLLVAAASVAGAAEPRVHIVGVWPDRMLYFDEASEEFVAEVRVRHGAVWHHDAALLPDFSRLYVITDRLESVEVIDLAARTVVDEFKLSTPSHTVRILRIAVDPSGRRVYSSIRSFQREPDRFIPERQHIVVYDMETREVVASFEPPRGFGHSRMSVSPDGSHLLLFGRELYLVSTTSWEIVETIALSEPHRAGYGSRQVSVREIEPGLFYGVYRTSDPVFGKPMFGVGRLDLATRHFDAFELGPSLRLGLLTLSPDKTRAYALARNTGASGEMNDLLVVDMENERLIARKEGFEQGRPNGSLIVSGDGTKLYSSGAGDAILVYDTSTLELIRSISTEGDVMLPARALPRSVLAETSDFP